MFRRRWSLLNTAAYLRLSSVLLRAARARARAGLQPKPTLIFGLWAADILSRAALASWRRAHKSRPLPGNHQTGRNLPKRSLQG